MRAALALTIIAFAAAGMADDEAQPYIEAYCDGGIDGRYQHATVSPDGTIRATNRHDASKPWDVVATDPEAANRWFAAIEAAAPSGPAPPPEIVVADGIECGLEVNKGQETVRYDLPEVLTQIVQHVPDYH